MVSEKPNLYLPQIKHYNEPMFNDCIIMAGGAGTRLWPASTSLKPKQFLSLPLDAQPASGRRGEKALTFFSAAIERALAATGDSADSHIVIIANRIHVNSIIEECSGLDAADRKRLVLIPEPLARNTAPAIACALLYIDWVSAGSERNILVLTSDHIIKPLNVFKTDANAAAAMAQADKLVVFGITPEKPETGYGYIEAAEALYVQPAENVKRKRRYEPEVYAVASFHEKPDLKKAEAFLAAKKYYWNSGMFAFSSKFLLDEFRRTAPDVFSPLSELMAPNERSHRTKKGLRILEEWDNLETAYEKVRAISFDYAIAEKCRSAVMVKAGFSWLDVGGWDEYARLAGKSNAEVYATGKAKETCFVDSDIPVALCGVEDLIVVVRSGNAGGDGKQPVALISKKGETQKVKEIVEKIRASGRTELL